MSKYNHNNPNGVRVAHDFDDFFEDREVILTLKDTYLLDNQDVNRDSDVLENIELAENFRRDAQQSNKKKLDDDYLEGKYGGEKKILPQYDEAPTEKQGIMLDSLGEYNLDRQRKIDSIKAKLAGPNKTSGQVSLETTKNIASEYLTSDEMKKFKKPMKKVVNVQKNKEDIIKFLEDSLEDDNETGSRDTRKAREQAALNDVVTKKLKTENYETALQKAREQTRSAAFIDDEYEEIQRSIDNQRRATQTGRNNKVEDVVRNLIETNTAVKAPQNIVIEINSKSKPADGNLVELDTITTSTDFLKNVSTRNDMAQQRTKTVEPTALSVRDTRDGTTSVVNVSLPSEKILAWNKAQTGLQSAHPFKKDSTKNGTDNTAEAKEEDPFTQEEVEKLQEEREFIQEETFETGMAAALKAARERGYLLENDTEVAGRHNDQTYRKELSKFGESTAEEGPRLEYRDRHGRIMTPKEAFRYQCRIFHGIAPSKTKQEKEKKKYDANKKRLSTAPQESGSMKALQRVQQQNNQAYAILDNKNQR